ncbi:hypothetical protein IV203_015636 [Nitzschia inconspicua]|uniref:Uncharacterized protein n=1 Tax=Nitzschia inconspicua TaxID=303405 RepID=A0A9K3LBB9_9STRA|nr:hypothetical protein IV203_015636 [Nitzschia inconspicua]
MVLVAQQPSRKSVPATFSSSSSGSPTAVPKPLPMASPQPLSSNSARFHPKDFVSRVVPPTDYRQLERDVEDLNPSMPDGTTVRHYHTHHNNQTYNIYVTGGLPAAGLTKQAGQLSDGSQDGSVLRKSLTHATLSSPTDGESFCKPNSL